jgi:hypothetical protein
LCVDIPLKTKNHSTCQKKKKLLLYTTSAQPIREEQVVLHDRFPAGKFMLHFDGSVMDMLKLHVVVCCRM